MTDTRTVELAYDNLVATIETIVGPVEDNEDDDDDDEE